MTAITPPTKQQTREQHPHDIPEQDVPPTREEIRRELGWTMIDAERQSRADGDERN
jgi:hypothetical protein